MSEQLPPQRSLRRYVRHAQLYGVDSVGTSAARTLREQCPSPLDLTWLPPAQRERILDERQAFFAEFHRAARRLQIELDSIEASRKGAGGKFTVGTRRRRSRTDTAVAAQLLADDGLTRVEIAAKLGVKVKTVDNLLSPGALQTTQHLRLRVRGIKTPANEGVKTGGLDPPEPGSATRFVQEQIEWPA